MDTKPFLAKTPVVIGLAILCNALWGSAIPFINLGYRFFSIPSGETAAQILFAGVRFFLSGFLTILLTSIPRKTLVRARRENLHMVMILALMQTLLQYVFFYIGVARTASVGGAIIQGMGAFVSILVACYIFHTETMNRLKWLGGAAGVLGVIVMNWGGEGALGGMKLTGEGFLFMSMFVSACSAGLIKIFSQKEDPVALSGWQFMLGGAVMAAGGFLLGGRLQPSGAGAFAVLAYLAMVSAVAYTIWGMLLKYNPVSRIAPFMFLQPIFGVILSLLFFGGVQESLGKYAAALVLVCLSILIINRGQQEKA